MADQNALLDLVLRLYERFHGHEPDDAKTAALAEIVVGNGLSTTRPAWLLELMTALVEDRGFSNRNIDFSEMHNQEYDISNFMAELAQEAAFPELDDGEYTVISFNPLNVSVCFDFEAYQGGVDIRMMRWPGGTGPHWDRMQTKPGAMEESQPGGNLGAKKNIS